MLLILAILAAWVQSFRVLEREPRARQIGAQVVSIVNLTRSALLYSDRERRRALLFDLFSNEGVRVAPLESGDRIEPFPSTTFGTLIAEQVRDALGAQTRLAAAVNGVRGTWVSFDIEGDAYWVMIEPDVLSRSGGRQWIAWAVASGALSLLAAVAITSAVNRPLAALSRAARRLGAGLEPEPLPDHGPAEIRAVNRSFNRMVDDLQALERDRGVLLAGISHDLRTPLTRLRLEVEINPLPEATRVAMTEDLAQMDAIVGQFLDYARPVPRRPAEPVDLGALATEAVHAARLDERDDTELTLLASPAVVLQGHRTELRRALENLLTNAERYGRTPDDGRLRLEVRVERSADFATIRVADRGPGVPARELPRLTRPFERGESARTGAAGAGLGLAIVERIARLHRGTLLLEAATPTGLACTLRLPLDPRGD